MAGSRRVERELHWRNVLERQAGSGLSIRQFCAQEGIGQPSFYAWRRRLGGRPNGGAGSPRARRKSAGTSGGSEFISLRLLDAASTLELVHPHGCRLRITGGVDPSVLQQVLDVLDARSHA